MPKLVHSLPRYRLHRRSGQAVVTLNGRDFYLGRHGSPESHQAYERLIGEHLARKRQPAVTSDEITIDALVIRYAEHADGYYVKNGHPTGVIHGIRSALRYLRRSYSGTTAAQFSPLSLGALQQKMVGDGLSRPYVNKLCSQIKQAFKWGGSKELVAVSMHQALLTVSGLKRGRTGSRRPPVPSLLFPPIRGLDNGVHLKRSVLPYTAACEQRAACSSGDA